MKILAVNLGGIGDLLISASSLKALKRRSPDAELAVLTAEQSRQAAVFMPFVDNWHTLSDLWRLRRRRFDLALNMRTMVSVSSAWKIRLLFTVIAARTWAGRDTAGRGTFFSVRIPEEEIGSRHEQEYDIELVRALGADPRPDDFSLDVPVEAKTSLAKRLAAAAVPDAAVLVTVHPGGKPSHRWPLEHFIELSRRLKQCFPQTVFCVSGSNGEQGLAAVLCRALGGNCLSFAGELSLAETAGLLKRSRLLLTNDTSVMHIAALLDVPQLAFFGPGYLQRFDPRRFSSRAAVLQGKTACVPCNRHRCAALTCLRQISVEQAAEAAQRLLSLALLRKG